MTETTRTRVRDREKYPPRDAAQFRQAVKDKGIRKWQFVPGGCSFCGYPTGFLFEGDDVLFDPGCWCGTRGPQPPEPRNYETVANQYNIQTSGRVIEEYDEFWGFRE